MRWYLLPVMVVGCTAPPKSPSISQQLASSSCTQMTPVGVVPEPLVELSGLVASRTHANVLYAHNDSGDVARFFALSATDARVLATFSLPNASANDWEDIAYGPCPTGRCVFLGDIGDNRLRRTDNAVYRVQEPKEMVTGDVFYERLAFEYPAGVKRNAEALLVHPTTGSLYVLTKEETGVPSQVYRFPEPLDTSKTVTLEGVAQLSVPTPSDVKLTAASFDPSGRKLLLRMYNRLVELDLPAGETSFERIFVQPPRDTPFADEPQGKAVAFSADGKSYFTASERTKRADVLLYRSTCK